MTDDVTLQTFATRIGQPFTVRSHSGSAVAITLTEAAAAPTDDDPRRTRTPFSLIFRVPAGYGVVQGMYVLEHEDVGAVDVFLVPIVPDRDGPRLQAIFA